MKPNILILSTALSAVALFSTQVGAQTPYAPGYPPQAAPAYGGPSGYSMMGGGNAMPYGPMGPAPGYAASPVGYQQGAPLDYQDPSMQPIPATDYGDYGPQAAYDQSVLEGSPYAETCQDASCNSCDLPPRVYGSADLLVMWRKNSTLPALLTTSAPADEGVIGAPTTQTLFGGHEQGDALTGVRLTTGLWLDDYQNWSVGGRFLALQREVLGISTTSAQFSTLAYPFFNTNTNMNASFVVALPGAGTNAADDTSVNIRKTNNFYTGDVFVTKHVVTSHANRVDFVTGYSFARIDDALAMNTMYTVRDGGGAIAAGSTVATSDNFLAKNDFNGGQFGLIFDFQDGPFTWRALTKISVGGMHQRMAISGSQTVTEFGVPSTAGQGYYARSSNIGNYQRDVFCYIPEANVDLIYALNGNLDLKVGCTYIYVSDVALAQSGVSGSLNPNGGDPVFQFASDDYWALGATFGLDFHY
ncbi:BBP7 family outer membrane beta-barrel protein [Blastopirellula sp. J2-11]|uniref:BBP7 family outer membrane beta-barrel protein n=1 Tax=Blastopirellula sp. J2-11 TaxID=2943192 RepID=UPI0021C89091|nr:BBP7 family outer membrane beta-barrel protein [Blastopirellula sp. J2-11]UUO08808.1 BBP7 family outer membrane beta-barrel protein [Blastopirellula sp. J2-11]